MLLYVYIYIYIFYFFLGATFQVKSSDAVAHIDFLGCIATADIDIMCDLKVLDKTAFLYCYVSKFIPAYGLGRFSLGKGVKSFFFVLVY
jgi:hypothetical protein